MCWYTVVLTSEMIVARLSIGISIILCSEKVLNLLYGGVEFGPAVTLGELDSTVINSGLCKPRLDRTDRLGGWRKSLLDLIFLARASTKKCLESYLLH